MAAPGRTAVDNHRTHTSSEPRTTQNTQIDQSHRQHRLRRSIGATDNTDYADRIRGTDNTEYADRSEPQTTQTTQIDRSHRQHRIRRSIGATDNTDYADRSGLQTTQNTQIDRGHGQHRIRRSIRATDNTNYADRSEPQTTQTTQIDRSHRQHRLRRSSEPQTTQTTQIDRSHGQHRIRRSIGGYRKPRDTQSSKARCAIERMVLLVPVAVEGRAIEAAAVDGSTGRRMEPTLSRLCLLCCLWLDESGARVVCGLPIWCPRRLGPLFVTKHRQRTTKCSSCRSTPSFVLSSTFQSPALRLSTVLRLECR